MRDQRERVKTRRKRNREMPEIEGERGKRVSVCVREREREKEREKDERKSERKRERKREREETEEQK